MNSVILDAKDRENQLVKLAIKLRDFAPGKRVVVEFKQYHGTRSQEQNRYLWGVCYKTLEEATGQEAEDWHELMLGSWSGWEVFEMFGQKRKRPVKRSSSLNKVEFADYVSFIHRKAAEYGIHIEDPAP